MVGTLGARSSAVSAQSAALQADSHLTVWRLSLSADIKKRVQALPFLHAFCPAKSLTRGEENIPQTIQIKQSPCQPRKVEF